MRRQRFQRRIGRNSRRFDYSWSNLQDIGEDILRVIVKEGEPQIRIYQLKKLCQNTKKLGRILTIMENQDLLILNDGLINLTDKGQKIGEKILRKHEAIETAFQTEIPSMNKHKIAHILEHNISNHDIEKLIYTQHLNNIYSLPLSKFTLPYATVYRITLKNERIFYKLIALGIYPGQRIEISCRNNYNQILTIKNSRFAIDKKLAEQIYVIP
ncbi:MAG: iron dependent repressor, metal binding and dimerization domain protein [Promethearchaeota archaeon]